jgi:hypothetical protein
VRGRALASAGLVAAGVSCAKVAPPPGGEIDREPPSIVECAPPPGAAGVAPDSAFTLVFSEPPDRRSVLRALTVIPAVDFAQTSWEKDTLRLVPEGGWAADRPTLITVDGRAKDRRDNEMGKAFRTRFTTGPAADSGSVAGRVWSGREVPQGGVLAVAAFDAADGDSADPVRQDPFALADADGRGEFRLVELDVGRRFRVVAMYDRDGDQRPESRGEIWREAPEMAVFLSPDEREVRLPDFLLGTLDSVGTISGEVRADSFAVAVVRAMGEAGATAREVLPAGGKFELKVPTGDVYRVAAFLDTDADSLAGEDEPIVEREEAVPLTLTAVQSGIRLDLIGLLAPPDSLAAPADTAAAPGGDAAIPSAPADTAAAPRSAPADTAAAPPDDGPDDDGGGE